MHLPLWCSDASLTRGEPLTRLVGQPRPRVELVVQVGCDALIICRSCSTARRVADAQSAIASRKGHSTSRACRPCLRRRLAGGVAIRLPAGRLRVEGLAVNRAMNQPVPAALLANGQAYSPARRVGARSEDVIDVGWAGFVACVSGLLAVPVLDRACGGVLLSARAGHLLALLGCGCHGFARAGPAAAPEEGVAGCRLGVESLAVHGTVNRPVPAAAADRELRLPSCLEGAWTQHLVDFGRLTGAPCEVIATSWAGRDVCVGLSLQRRQRCPASHRVSLISLPHPAGQRCVPPLPECIERHRG
mmetsp:Transcript_732/g.2584  ORF Transcript_732/g.2584 Transcript_732/m.2584 type:complete len:303 (-) Transcript_732:999-1907(-)